VVCQTKEKALVFDDVRVQQILIQLLSNLVERLKPKSEILVHVATSNIPRKSQTKVTITVSHKQSETNSVVFNSSYEAHLQN
jgi:C4-dicarboxylate-specific signal transduction histidine kinase